jgi:4-aminobutyrate aminotransferase-like enzyme
MEELLSLNRFDPATIGRLDAGLRDLLERRDRVFGPASVLFYDQPVEVVSARGSWMFGPDGTRYLDMYNNVPSIGHCHPRIVAAMAEQAAMLNIHSRYLNERALGYAERLLALLPDALTRLVLTCTGSESNDLALRMARRWTGAEGFIVTRGAYHGNSTAVTDISPSSMPRSPLPSHVRSIATPEIGAGGVDEVGGRMAAAVDRAVAELKAAGHGFAGLVVDSIFSSDGVFPHPAGFLHPVAEAVRRAGGLFIADEVQGGFGRTGRHWWSFERHGVVPDIVTMGKPMGNGYPMGGLAVRPDILDAFCAQVSYFNTFGGSPVAAAVGTAVLDVIVEEDLIANADRVGAHMLERLATIAAVNPALGAPRGAGLFIGVDIVDPDAREAPDARRARILVNRLRDAGVLISAAGVAGNTLKIRPPLCITEGEADIFLAILEDVLGSLSS